MIEQFEKELMAKFDELEKISTFNTKKVLDAFKKNRVGYNHFAGTTGYGYADVGRDTLRKVFADIFCTEDAIVSSQIACGTSALTLALFGLLKSGDVALSITGQPYDTMKDVLVGEGGLIDYNIKFESVALKNGQVDFDKVKQKIKKLKPKIIYFQRSRGYEQRSSFNIGQMQEIFADVKKLTGAKIVVDNCYGEFTETREPTEVGADVCIGSLIKNIGGGLAPTGGYIVGDKKSVELVNKRLNSPSLGGEVGSFEAGYRMFYQGLFIAPSVVKNALKGVLLTSKVMRHLGYEVLPKEDDILSDIVCSIKFNNREKMISFCQSVQANSPVESYATPEPWDMPGYNDPVIMAAGTFVAGSSIELSCDGAVREPYTAYMQGGLCYEHVKIVLSEFLKNKK